MSTPAPRSLRHRLATIWADMTASHPSRDRTRGDHGTPGERIMPSEQPALMDRRNR
ncbi:hypothetical protein K6U06_21790 [Acidiferrimicrobium sp. IK]|uniref:hypothetical protein n=1 Tax=Acidiferrimicrobium sp. IK TaxID=2871700 RepID=UPI0021CB17F9|nr:hypothetical protein [Acidiferrimicrobium sp. IK]MCU4187013.1 hypothetical protein [Acidiferrimicrobium sp. IK]